MGSKDVANFLLAHGADVNAKNNNGGTPLRVAEYSRQGSRRVLTGGIDAPWGEGEHERWDEMLGLLRRKGGRK